MSMDKGSKNISPENKSPDGIDRSGFLRRRRRAIREVALDTSLPSAEMSHNESDPLPVYDLDLSDKIKVIFINGRGNTGKTVFLRLNGEIQLSNNLEFVLAACDIGSRSAQRYFAGIMTPDTNKLEEIIAFIKDAIVDAAETGRTILIDMGAAGETAILPLNTNGELTKLLREIGVTPVFIHMIGTSVDDVSVLKSFVQNGLCPPTTALIFNEMNVGVGTHRDTAFGLVRAQPCVHQAIERGAAVLRLPALDREIATEVEARELLYGDAGAGKIGKLPELGPLGPFDRSSLRVWHREALRQLSPIGTWLSWPPSIHEMFR